jgi:peptidoglycan/LPS O-acetylase OafA/YrhL
VKTTTTARARGADLTSTRSAPHLAYAPAIDGLRAISVTAVMLWHNNPTGNVPGGFLGVEVFFVLSGYLITSLLLVEWSTQGRVSLRHFYARRARRLLPALFVMLAVVAAYSVVFLRTDSHLLVAQIVSTLTYTTNWLFIMRHVSYVAALGRPPLFQHLWSLAIEEQFYLVWPIVFVALLRASHGRRAPVIGVILTCAAASAAWMSILYGPYADPSRVYFGTDTHATGLLLGAAFAIVWRPDRLSTRTGTGAPVVLDLVGLAAIAGLGVFFFDVRYFDSFLYHGGFVALGLLTLAVLAVAVHPASRIVRCALGGRPLRWIGVRSYGLYLWHWPIYLVTRARIDVPLHGSQLLALRLGLTTIAACLSYRYVEQPIRSGSLGRRTGPTATNDAWREDPFRPHARLGVAAVIVIALFALGAAHVRLPDPRSRALGSTLSRSGKAPIISLPTSDPSQATASPTTNVPRPRRVVIVGDSVGHFAYVNRPNGLAASLTLSDGTTEGCGIAEGIMTSSIGYQRNLTAECHGWETKWADAARTAHAQVALVFIGAWEVFDLRVNGQTLPFGTPAWDHYLDAQLHKGIAALKATGAQISLEEIPCWRPVDNGSGTTAFPERGDDPRTRHLNQLIEHAAANDPSHVFAFTSPPQYCTDPAVATSLSERWDGVHYGQAGATRLFNLLTPQLLNIPIH